MSTQDLRQGREVNLTTGQMKEAILRMAGGMLNPLTDKNVLRAVAERLGKLEQIEQEEAERLRKQRDAINRNIETTKALDDYYDKRFSGLLEED